MKVCDLLNTRPNVSEFDLKPYGYIFELTKYIDRLEKNILGLNYNSIQKKKYNYYFSNTDNDRRRKLSLEDPHLFEYIPNFINGRLYTEMCEVCLEPATAKNNDDLVLIYTDK